MPHLPDSSHDTHDLELVAAHAAGDAQGADLDRALALVASCPECATLHRDLRAIAAAVPALPAPVRPRDFRLTADEAARLRPAGIRGLLAAFSGPRFAFATPLGTGLAALGIVGILVASGGIPTGGPTSAPAERGTGPVTVQAAPEDESASDAAANGPADAPIAGIAASGSPAAEAPSADVDTMGGGEPSAAPAAPPEATQRDLAAPSPEASAGPGSPFAALVPAPSDGTPVSQGDAIAAEAAGADPLLVGAVAALVAGLGLVSVRVVARRRA